MRKYKLATSKGLYDTNEYDFDQLQQEQQDILKSGYYAIHILNNVYSYEQFLVATDLLEICERIAIKDGIDIVIFDNGLKGILGYYNGVTTVIEYIEISRDSLEYYEENENEIEKLFIN